MSVMTLSNTREGREIIPTRFKDRSSLQSIAATNTKLAIDDLLFHTVRVPLYWARLAATAPRGMWKTAKAADEFYFNAARRERAERAEAELARAGALAEAQNNRRTQRSYREAQSRATAANFSRKFHTGIRLWPSLAAGVGGGGYATFEFLQHSLLFQVPAGSLAAAGVLAGFGLIGKDRERAVISINSKSTRITAPMVTEALVALRIGIKDIDDVDVVSDPHRDGDGYVTIVDLPGKVLAEDVIKARKALAGALKRETGQVWLSQVKGDVSRLRIFISDVDLSDMKQGEWPIKSLQPTDYYGEIPVANNEHGGLVCIRPAEQNIIAIAATRGAKTTFLRALAAGLSMDPTVRFRFLDPKGTEFVEFEPLAEDFVGGRDEESVKRMFASIVDLDAECTRRTALLREAGFRKVTREVSQQVPGLEPMVWFLDECHHVLNDPVDGPEARRLLAASASVNAGLGITLVLASQRGIADAIPKSVTANFTGRFCGRVVDQVETDSVLGPGAWGQGFKANEIEGNTGMAFIAGQGNGIEAARVFNPDDAELAAVLQHAIALRWGPVTKVDITPDTSCPSNTASQQYHQVTEVSKQNLLLDIAAVVEPGQGLWYREILAALAVYGDRYAKWTAMDLGRELRNHKVRTIGIGRKDDPTDRKKVTNNKGIQTDDLFTAIEQQKEQAA